MKKVFTGLTILLFILSACAPQSATELPNQADSGMISAQNAAVTALSESMSLPADQIAVVSTETVTWPDGCLGIVRMGVMCTQAEVPGFNITLEVGGEQYEFHTNKDGSVVTLAEGAHSPVVAEDTVIRQLAQNLGLSESDISAVSDTLIEFSDSCLGVAVDEMMCAQVVTPGHIIVLEANGLQFEYHTNEDGSRVQPATFALTWKREGGFAGFCDRMTVFLSGEVYGSQCKTVDGRMGTFASLLSGKEKEQLFSWLTDFDAVDLDASDPEGVADGMSLVIELYGRGKGKPDKTVQDNIFGWAQDLYQKLYVISSEPAELRRL